MQNQLQISARVEPRQTQPFRVIQSKPAYLAEIPEHIFVITENNPNNEPPYLMREHISDIIDGLGYETRFPYLIEEEEQFQTELKRVKGNTRSILLENLLSEAKRIDTSAIEFSAGVVFIYEPTNTWSSYLLAKAEEKERKIANYVPHPESLRAEDPIAQAVKKQGFASDLGSLEEEINRKIRRYN